VIPQAYPLFAINSDTAAVYLVVGWAESVAGYERFPVLAPVSAPGPTRMVQPDRSEKLIYSTQPRPLYPLPPAGQDTAVIPAVPAGVRPSAPRIRPGRA
jgi:hypothetical protein